MEKLFSCAVRCSCNKTYYTSTGMIILCACGCGKKLEETDKYGRPHKFIFGHQSKGRKYKTEKYITRRGKNHYFWKGGRVMGSDGYVLIYKPDHPYCNRDGYIREHRLVMEEYLGRYLDPKEVVHHINGNKTDNRIENLELVSDNGNHHKLHHPHERDPITGRFLKL